MTLNWGTRITLLYCGFVALIVFLVVNAMLHPTALVAEDYYQQEITFQKRIDATKASSALSAPLSIVADAGTVSISFPEEFKGKDIAATIHFYAPANAAADRTLLLNTSNSKLEVDRARLQRASYKVQLDWRADGKEYFQEVPLNILKK